MGTAEDLDRFSRRTVKVTKEHNEECRRLLMLMGIPVVVVRSSIILLNFDLVPSTRLLRRQRHNVLNLLEVVKYDSFVSLSRYIYDL